MGSGAGRTHFSNSTTSSPGQGSDRSRSKTSGSGVGPITSCTLERPLAPSILLPRSRLGGQGTPLWTDDLTDLERPPAQSAHCKGMITRIEPRAHCAREGSAEKWIEKVDRNGRIAALAQGQRRIQGQRRTMPGQQPIQRPNHVNPDQPQTAREAYAQKPTRPGSKLRTTHTTGSRAGAGSSDRGA